MTSDTSDIPGPIPLTRAGLEVRPVVSLMFVLCYLAPVNAWHTPCPRSRVLLVFGVSRTLPGMKLTRHEKSNDDRGTLYLGPQRSRSTLRGGSAQKPCGNRIFEFAKA